MLLKEDNMIVNMRQTYKKNDEYYRFEISFNPILDITKYKKK